MGHFLLTNLLMPKVLLAATASPSAQPPRIINVSSKGHELTPAEVEDYNFKGSTSPEAKDGDNYNPWVAYGRSKSANISFARSLAKKVGPKGVLAFSLHPGSE